MGAENKRSIRDLHDAIQQMPEYKLHQLLMVFDNSIYIFEQNYRELAGLVEKMITDPAIFTLLGTEHREDFRILQLEVLRKLHNFVAAVKSLLDHTYRLKHKLYKKGGTFPDYQARVDHQFVNDPSTQFIQDLREFCQHYRIPDLGFNVKVEAGAETVTLTLLVNDLLEFDGWGDISKKFIQESGEYVNLKEVIDAYHANVIHFYQWFQSRQEQIHADEFARLHELQTEYANLLLESWLNTVLVNQNEPRFNEIYVFAHILTQAELAELRTIAAPNERASYVIILLEKYYKLTESVVAKINDAYTIPHFYAS